MNFTFNVPLQTIIRHLTLLKHGLYLRAIDGAKIDSRYSTLLKNIYKRATFRVKITKDLRTDKISINKGFRHGDLISPQLFTLVFGDLIKKLPWENINENGNRTFLNHLLQLCVLQITSNIKLFADYRVFISSDLREFKQYNRTTK